MPGTLYGDLWPDAAGRQKGKTIRIKKASADLAALVSGGFGCLLQFVALVLHIWAVVIVYLHQESILCALVAMCLPVIATIWACVLSWANGQWLYPGVCIGYLLTFWANVGFCLVAERVVEVGEDEPPEDE